jgi:hypothetical protein
MPPRTTKMPGGAGTRLSIGQGSEQIDNHFVNLPA